MKILLVHNYYQQPGGEDQVFSTERDVLEANGDEVRTYTMHNSQIASMGKLRVASSTIWNPQVFRKLSAVMEEYVPDIVHCHNTFPLISPAAYAAAARVRIPVIQTLHNFRLLCLNGLFLRNGRACEDCLGRIVAWPGVLHACYRQNRQASTVVATMLAVHRWRGTWDTAVDTFIAMSEFARAKFVIGGLPADRIVVKPNFLGWDPGPGAHHGGYALYVGRLSPEKGLDRLVRLWRQLDPGIPLRIIGDGPLETLAADSPPTVAWLGRQSRDQVIAAMKDASFLVFPTECYEGFPMVILEAMATGLPVIASHQGSLPDIVKDRISGVLVPAGDPEHWAAALRWAITHPEALTAMGQQARKEFESRYTPEIGYRLLCKVYQQTLQRSRYRVTPTVVK